MLTIILITQNSNYFYTVINTTPQAKSSRACTSNSSLSSRVLLNYCCGMTELKMSMYIMYLLSIFFQITTYLNTTTTTTTTTTSACATGIIMFGTIYISITHFPLLRVEPSAFVKVKWLLSKAFPPSMKPTSSTSSFTLAAPLFITLEKTFATSAGQAHAAHVISCTQFITSHAQCTIENIVNPS